MRIRSIKPEFWSSQSNGRLSRNARLVFVGLISVADNFGRFRAEPRVLAGTILPYDRDAVSVVRRSLAELVSEGKIELFEHERSVFGAISSFLEHQWMKSRGSPVHPDPRDPGSIPLERQAFYRLTGGENRLGEGIRDKGQGSGVKDQGSGEAADRSPKPRTRKPKPPIQPELPGTPPPPPKPPRALSAQEEAFEIYAYNRRDFLKQPPPDGLGLEDPPADVDRPEPAYLNLSLRPILEAVAHLNRPDEPTRGFELLLEFWFQQRWGAEASPPFPFTMFVACALDRGPKLPDGPDRPGLITRFLAGRAHEAPTQGVSRE